MPVAIRLAGPEDAAALLSLQHRLDSQSSYMLLEPGERTQEPDRLAGPGGGFDLIAAEDGAMLGWLSAEVLPFRRARHTGYLVLGVDADAAGRGIGGGLLAEAAEEAERRGLRRLELTVMTDNLRALGLYLRSGFEVEGLRRQALVRNGAFVDEYYMGKLLGQMGLLR
jgi:ribosomal protein S18 acetylase RimI-like enzyme